MAKGTYENGERDATIESLTKSLDEHRERFEAFTVRLEKRLDDLPCLGHRTTLRIHWILFGAIATLILAGGGMAIHYLT